MRILVIEDDVAVGNLITTTLEMENYQFRLAKTAKQGIMNVLSYNPDIMLLDLGLPDMDGLEVIKKVRSWSNIPIIVVSARSEDQDKVQALDLGADDYLTKPFSVDELLARLRVTIRRLNNSQTISVNESVYENGDLTINYAQGCVYENGREIHLTPIEYKLLCVLAKNTDKVLTHNSLTTLDVLAVGLILITVFETALSIARNYVFAHTTSKIDVILSCRLFKHLFSLPLRYFETRRVGDTIARVRELENIRRFLTGVPLNTLLDALFIIVYIIIMYFYSVRLTNITLLSLSILAAITAIITPILKARLDDKFKAGADQQSYLVETVNGVQTIKSFAVEPGIEQKWEGLLAD